MITHIPQSRRRYDFSSIISLYLIFRFLQNHPPSHPGRGNHCVTATSAAAVYQRVNGLTQCIVRNTMTPNHWATTPEYATTAALHPENRDSGSTNPANGISRTSTRRVLHRIVPQPNRNRRTRPPTARNAARCPNSWVSTDAPIPSTSHMCINTVPSPVPGCSTTAGSLLPVSPSHRSLGHGSPASLRRPRFDPSRRWLGPASTRRRSASAAVLALR